MLNEKQNTRDRDMFAARPDRLTQARRSGVVMIWVKTLKGTSRYGVDIHLVWPNLADMHTAINANAAFSDLQRQIVHRTGITPQGVAESWVSILNPDKSAPLVSRWPHRKALAELGVRHNSHVTLTLYDPARLMPACEPPECKQSWLWTLFRRVKNLFCRAYQWATGRDGSDIPKGTVRLLIRTTNSESPLLAISKLALRGADTRFDAITPGALSSWSCQQLYQTVYARANISLGGQQNSSLVRTYRSRGVPYTRGRLPRSASKTLDDIEVTDLCDLTLLIHLPGGVPVNLVLMNTKKPCPEHPGDRPWLWKELDPTNGLYFLSSDRAGMSLFPYRELARAEAVSDAKDSQEAIPDIDYLRRRMYSFSPRIYHS